MRSLKTAALSPCAAALTLVLFSGCLRSDSEQPVHAPERPSASANAQDSELARRAAQFESLSFTAEYELHIASDGFSADGVLVWYQAPRKRRGDFRGAVNGQDTDVTVLRDLSEKSNVVCDKTALTCATSRPKDEGIATVPGEYAVVLTALYVGAQEWSESVRVVSSRDDTRVGDDVRCFTAEEAFPEPNSPGNTGEMCVTEDGVALSVDIEQFGRHAAKSFMREANADYFALPFPLATGS